MKIMKVLFIQNQQIKSLRPEPVRLIEQTFESEGESLDIPVPLGFTIMSITEILPNIKINSNVKKVTN